MPQVLPTGGGRAVFVVLGVGLANMSETWELAAQRVVDTEEVVVMVM